MCKKVISLLHLEKKITRAEIKSTPIYQHSFTTQTQMTRHMHQQLRCCLLHNNKTDSTQLEFSGNPGNSKTTGHVLSKQNMIIYLTNIMQQLYI